MPHADASNFADGITKRDAYDSILTSLKGLVDGQRNWVCNTANASSLMWHMFHSLSGSSSAVNWAGFYVLDSKKSNQLILGPFHGKVACQTIQIGKGVCGQVAATGRTLLIKDVESFPGHIACDGDSKSEIVVPILVDGICRAVIDIDCAELSGFDDVDQERLEALAALLAGSCDW